MWMTEKNGYFRYTKHMCHSRRVDKKTTNEFKFLCKECERVGMGRYLIVR